MQLKILGARQGESRYSHFSSLIIDNKLVLDAGGLTSTLSLEEQANIHAVLLTHQHLDHIKDLAALGFNLSGRSQVTICCTYETRAAIEATILNEQIWLNFFQRPKQDAPTFVHCPVQPGQSFSLGGYRILPVSVNHTVQAVAYEVMAPSGARLLYTGDNGPGSANSWATPAPDLLITEVSYPDAMANLAAQYGHLSACLLAEELKVYRNRCGFLPPVLVVHSNPYHETQIAAEVAALASELVADIKMAQEGSYAIVDPKPHSDRF